MSLNKDFLEKNLGESISNFEVSDGAKPGDNVAGCLKSIKVTTASGKTLNLVYKGLTDNVEFKEYVKRFRIFLIEATMYETVVPRVEALLKTRCVKKTELSVPKFFSGQHEGEDLYILLEDVRPFGYVMPDKFKGLNLAEVTLIMMEIARFHASTYFWIKYEGENIFDEEENSVSVIKDFAFLRDDEQMKFIATTFLTNEVTNAIQLLKNRNHPDWAQKLQTIVDSSPEAVYKLARQTSKLTDIAFFPCIIHGDLWINNVMIKYDLNGNPMDVKFLDLQQSRRGNIIEELEYFFLCSTTTEFRKKHLAQVLNVYYDAFIWSLEELECPVPIGFTRGILIETFYQELLPGYIYMIFAIPFQLTQPLELTAMAELAAKTGGDEPAELSPIEMMRNNLTMRSKMFYMQMMNSPKAIDRLVDVTREMIDMKIL